MLESDPAGGGYFHQNRTWSCLPDLENLTFSIPIFLPNFSPISIPFSKEKHPILTKLGVFYNNLPKIQPIYVIWAPSSLMKTPRHYTKFREKAPQKAGTYTYACQYETPPRDPVMKNRIEFQWGSTLQQSSSEALFQSKIVSMILGFACNLASENFTFHFRCAKMLNFRPFLVLIYKYRIFMPPFLRKFCKLQLKILNFRPCFSLIGKVYDFAGLQPPCPWKFCIW